MQKAHATLAAALLVALSACGGGSAAPSPTSLAFRTQPGSTRSGAALAPALQVEIRDGGGAVMTGSTAQVTLAISSPPAGVVLAGTVTVAAVGGVATFGDLSVARTATGLRLAASSPGLSGATSAPFDVTPGAPAALAFAVEPGATTGGIGWTPAVTVSVHDAAGNLVDDAPVDVTLALEGGSGGAQLGGTTTVASASGQAAFGDLAVDLVGAGYQLAATAPGLPVARSAPFDVTAGPAARLAFLVEPGDARSTVALAPAVEVEARDAGGNPVADGTTQIALAFPAGVTWPARLSGAGATAVTGGVARFAGLSVDGDGTFRLEARATGAAPATSAPFAVTAAWVPAGPDGGQVLGLAQDLRSADAALAALGEGGLWRTADLGGAWSAVALPGRPAVDGAAFAPSGSGVAVAWGAGGVYLGAADGVSWRDVSPPLSAYGRAAWGPGDVLYLLGTDLAGLPTLLSSGDGGASWAPVDPPLPVASFLALGVASDGTLFVNTYDPVTTVAGVVRLAPGASTWTTAGTGIPAPQVYCLAFHPTEPQVAWAGSTAAVFKTVDGGATWAELPFNGATVFGLHLDPADPKVLLASTYGAGVWRTADGGDTWAPTGTLQAWESRAATGTGDRLLAGSDGGVFASTDAGASWVRASAGLRAMSPAALAHHPTDTGTLLAAGSWGQLFRTSDGGATWSRSVPQVGAWVRGFAWDAADPRRVYAAADLFGLLRSEDGGVSWARVTGFSGTVKAVAVGGGSPGVVWAATSYPGGLYRSVDGGLTFGRLAAFPAGAEPGGLAADRWSALVAWVGAAVSGTPAAAGLYTTGDGGASFTQVAGTASLSGADLRMTATSPLDLWASGSSAVWHSTDGGATWPRVTPSPSPGQLWGLGLDPSDGRRAFVGSPRSGALVTADGGATWTQLRRGLPATVNQIEVDPTAPDTVWAGTSSGIYRSTTGGY